jgi:hypothetical protein
MPRSIRLDKRLRSLLAEGARRTPFNQRELLRRTLRIHLREIIQREATPPEARVTNIDPWPRCCLAKAYRRADRAGAFLPCLRGFPGAASHHVEA